MEVNLQRLEHRDKNGQPYQPLTEEDLERIRNRPYPEDFTRLSQSLAARAARTGRGGRKRPHGDPDDD